MPNDYWDNHNIGMRFMVVVFTISFIVLVGAAINGVHIDYHIIVLVGAICALSFIVLAIGEENTSNIIKTIIKKFTKGD